MSLRKFDESVPSPRCPWNAANITVTDPTVAVHVADQEASACLGGGQGVAHSVMDVSQGDRYLLLVAGLTVERRQERVRIIWINTQAAACSAAGGCAVGPVTSLLNVKPMAKRFPSLRSSRPGGGISKELCRSVFLGIGGLGSGCGSGCKKWQSDATDSTAPSNGLGLRRISRRRPAWKNI